VLSGNRATPISAPGSGSAPLVIGPTALYAILAVNAQFDQTVRLDASAQAERAAGNFTEEYHELARYAIVNIWYPTSPIEPGKSFDGCPNYAHSYKVDIRTLAVREVKAACS
jgi:hypothetical protein